MLNRLSAALLYFVLVILSGFLIGFAGSALEGDVSKTVKVLFSSSLYYDGIYYQVEIAKLFTRK